MLSATHESEPVALAEWPSDVSPGSGQVTSASCLSVVLWCGGRSEHHLCFTGDETGE